MLLSISAVILAVLVGFLAQRTGLCMVRGVHELIARRPAFLFAILCCGFWYWLIVPFSGKEWVPFLTNRFDATFHFLIGGLLFGLGAALNKGCSISTISKLASGHFYMLSTITGWVIGWLLLPQLTPSLSYYPLEAIHTPLLYILIPLLLLLFVTIIQTSVERRSLLYGVLFFGITASLLTLIKPEWSPSQLLKDISYSFYHNETVNWPALERYFILAGLISGMAVGSKSRLPLNELQFRYKQVLIHLFAGTIMGLGASMALGGNDSQLLIALPAFSPSGAVTILFMIIGIATGLALRKAYKRIAQK